MTTPGRLIRYRSSERPRGRSGKAARGGRGGPDDVSDAMAAACERVGMDARRRPVRRTRLRHAGTHACRLCRRLLVRPRRLAGAHAALDQRPVRPPRAPGGVGLLPFAGPVSQLLQHPLPTGSVLPAAAVCLLPAPLLWPPRGRAEWPRLRERALRSLLTASMRLSPRRKNAREPGRLPGSLCFRSLRVYSAVLSFSLTSRSSSLTSLISSLTSLTSSLTSRSPCLTSFISSRTSLISSRVSAAAAICCSTSCSV